MGGEAPREEWLLLSGVATAEWFGDVFGVFVADHVKRPRLLPEVELEPVWEADRCREMPPVTTLWVEALLWGLIFWFGICEQSLSFYSQTKNKFQVENQALQVIFVTFKANFFDYSWKLAIDFEKFKIKHLFLY